MTQAIYLRECPDCNQGLEPEGPDDSPTTRWYRCGCKRYLVNKEDPTKAESIESLKK